MRKYRNKICAFCKQHHEMKSVYVRAHRAYVKRPVKCAEAVKLMKRRSAATMKYTKTPKGRLSRARIEARSCNHGWGINLKQHRTLLDMGCYYCGANLHLESGSALDRINPKRGYYVNNVIPCCGKCNVIRGNRLTVEEMKIAMAAVLDFRKKLRFT